jgi:hypothetical protein
MAPALLLLTEDSGGQGVETLRAIVGKMLRLVEPLADLRRVGFEPGDAAARTAMNFNGWKERGPAGDRKRLDLRQSIATRLLRQDGLGFVVLHFDGDLRWGESEGGTTGPNWEAFRRLLLPGIELLLQKKNQPERIKHLLYVVPFRCMESWLYQNRDLALRIYREEGAAPAQDLRRFEQEWRDDPGALDEQDQCPKDLVRLADRHNQRLAAEHFPAERTYQLGKSFAASVERLRACGPLLLALQTVRFERSTAPASVPS